MPKFLAKWRGETGAAARGRQKPLWQIFNWLRGSPKACCAPGANFFSHGPGHRGPQGEGGGGGCRRVPPSSLLQKSEKLRFFLFCLHYFMFHIKFYIMIILHPLKRYLFSNEISNVNESRFKTIISGIFWKFLNFKSSPLKCFLNLFMNSLALYRCQTMQAGDKGALK